MRLVGRLHLAMHPANVCDVRSGRSLSFLGSFCPLSAPQEQTDRSVSMENDGPTMIRIVCLPHNSEWITAPFSCMQAASSTLYHGSHRTRVYGSPQPSLTLPWPAPYIRHSPVLVMRHSLIMLSPRRSVLCSTVSPPHAYCYSESDAFRVTE
jgi:hypothetical protein